MNLGEILIKWYGNHKRDLPWRHTKNPYYIWLSEIILQQTQVKQGLPYYNAFVEDFPTVFDLAEATEDSVLKLWQGLGYYTRARNLHLTAKFIAANNNGKFPNNYEQLLKLKGVGDYTASAVASIAFNEVRAVVDGNVYRVLSRFFGITTPINTSKGIKEFKQLANSLINKKQPATFNQAIMEFGAIQCKPKIPNCTICPLNFSCVALQKQKINLLPVKQKTVKVKVKYFNFLVCIDNKNNTLLEKRIKKGIWQNLYQFPMVESDRSLDYWDFNIIKTDKKFLKNSFNFSVELFNTKDILHKLSHRNIYAKFWIIKLDQLPKEAISIEELQSYPVPTIISNFIKDFKL